MTQAILQAKFENLPDNYKTDVLDFINFLNYKINQKNNSEIPNLRDGFGCLKGKISMSDDFDEPLEDFREYM